MPQATCHPDRLMHAKGLCRMCCTRAYRVRRRGGLPATPRPVATCHPDRPHYGRGMCSMCYQQYKRARRRAGVPPTKGLPPSCHPTRPHEAKGLCRRCYRKQRYDELERPALLAKMRAAGHLPRTDWPDVSAATLIAWREAHGWSQGQCARALHYAQSTWHSWERQRKRIPPDVAAFMAAHPAPAPLPSAVALPGALRNMMRRTGLRIRELAEFAGVSELTAIRWCAGRCRLPVGVRAWMRAGCPRLWRWAPEPLPNVIGTSRLALVGRAKLRPAPRYFKAQPTLAADYQPRPGAPMPPCERCGRIIARGQKRRGLCSVCYARTRAQSA